MWYKFCHGVITRIESNNCLPTRFIFYARWLAKSVVKWISLLSLIGEQKILMLPLRMTEMHKIVFFVVSKGKLYGYPSPPFLGAGAGNTITANSYLDMLTWPLPQSSYKMECLLPSIWLFRTTWTHFVWRWISWVGVSDVWCRWMPRSPHWAPCNFLFGWLHKIHSVYTESARVEALRQ